MGRRNHKLYLSHMHLLREGAGGGGAAVVLRVNGGSGDGDNVGELLDVIRGSFSILDVVTVMSMKNCN